VSQVIRNLKGTLTMQASDVRIGDVYYHRGRLSGIDYLIKISDPHPAGGWWAIDLRRLITLWIKSPERLRPLHTPRARAVA
jgi:hypothetical protein